ncbi:MAG: hypothetical protein KDB82_13270 [Planctomycetes bacterium]|nr:hypothetical protein [Planctomycetota bacterium]
MVEIAHAVTGLAIPVVLAGATLFVIRRRKSRLTNWAKQNSMVQEGSVFRRVGGGPRLELRLEEVAMGGSTFHHQLGENLHITIHAVAEVPATLPAGLEIHSATYRGRTGAKDFKTGDPDIDARFRLCALDRATAKAMFAQTDFANALLNVSVSVADLQVRDGVVTLRMWDGQETMADQRPLLDDALNSAILAAHVLASGAEAVPIEGELGQTRPVFASAARADMPSPRLPQPRLPLRRTPPS